MNFNNDLFRARIYHGLKSILTSGDTLPPRFLEYAICEAFGLIHVGDGNFYADGVDGNEQASIKTRMLNPNSLKRKEGRDFQTHPDKFLGPQVNQKHDRWTAGLEIVQRRQALDFDDVKASPDKIGFETLKNFVNNITESFEKYNTTVSQEIIGVHGYDHTGKFYLISLFWKEYEHIDPAKLEWKREGYGVSGYAKVGDKNHKLVERVNGNAKREATCFKEYKNLTKYKCSAGIKLPLPDPWEFNKDAILAEINLKELSHDNSILFTE
jgi:hypothetical protein